METDDLDMALLLARMRATVLRGMARLDQCHAAVRDGQESLRTVCEAVAQRGSGTFLIEWQASALGEQAKALTALARTQSACARSLQGAIDMAAVCKRTAILVEESLFQLVMGASADD